MDAKFRVSMPPDPNPRTPKLKAPAGACDTLFHVFGPPHAFPYAENRRYTPPAAPIEHCLAMLDAIGIDRGVVVQPRVHATDNRVSLNAIAVSGGRLRGVVRINDDTSDNELADMDAGGIRGIRFEFMHGPQGHTDLELFDRMIDRIRPLGWHVELHIDPDNLIKMEDWFRALDMVCVIDHFARIKTSDGIDQPGFQVLLDLMRRDNYWTKISGADGLTASPWPYPDVVPFAHALIEVAPDRLMWGSNWPHSGIFELGQTANDGLLLDLMLDFAPDEGIRNQILVDNPARLFGFPD